MDIIFSSKRLLANCTIKRKRNAKYGADMAKVIGRRLDDLRDAPTLETLRHLPGRLHELHGDREGQLTLDLRGQYRLILVPAHEPAPKTSDGGLDWPQVTAVKIIDVEDTHA